MGLLYTMLRGMSTICCDRANIFGDLNQVVAGSGLQSWNDIHFIRNRYTLDENFRNTNQIVEYCNRLFPFDTL